MNEFQRVNYRLFKGLEIITIESKNPNDSRGPTHEMWPYQFFGQITFYTRYKNTTSGEHYHLGDDKSKNPEEIFLVSGMALLTLYNPQMQKLELSVKGGSNILIYPGVWHSIKSLRSKIIIAEPRRTRFNPEKPDTYRVTLDEYLRLISNGHFSQASS